MKTYRVVVRAQEGGWWVLQVPEVPGCLTQAPEYHTLGAEHRIRDALSLFVDDAWQCNLSFVLVRQPGRGK